MIRLSALLVAVATGLLISGVITSKLSLVYLAIALSGAAFLLLIGGAAVKWRVLFGETRDAPEVAEQAVPQVPVTSLNVASAAPFSATNAWSPADTAAPEREDDLWVPRAARQRQADPFPASDDAPAPAPAAPRPAEPAWAPESAWQPQAAWTPETAETAWKPEPAWPPAPEPEPAAFEPEPELAAAPEPAAEPAPAASPEPALAEPSFAEPAPAPAPEPIDAAEAEPASTPEAAEAVPDTAEPPPADDEADPLREVTVVPGVPRYHDARCILIRFMGEGDLEKTTLAAARRSGCTPCRACLPD